MSKTIDQKVVQMQFDNAQFEQNAKQSMSTLDKLKAALKFDGANKGVDELNKSIGNLDFSKAEVMATKAGFHIQDVFLKISNVLEYQIARKIINLSENIAKSMTLDQVKAGFSEYELKMGSIQTIMAGTGEKLEVVNKYLNELNEYSDKTIYSFSDMTQNIGKFTNAGVKLKDAVAAIQGVANVAAVSGANANEASRAMYNFAQALSAGYVKLIDWKSIENANMATVEFKDTLLQTAVAMGYAKDNGDGYYKVLTRNAQGKTMDSAISATKNFNDSLAFQWMKTNVLTQALEIYSKDVRTMTKEEKDAYEEKLRGIGFTDKQIQQFEDLGVKATKAASEVKTFSQLMDTIKESIGSGWAQSFEIIIGDFNEAKKLLTEVNDAIGIAITKIDKQRNKVLENWKKMGGRNDLIQAFRNLAEALVSIFEPIKQVFEELFGKFNSDSLYALTKGFKDWTASIKLNKEQQEELRLTLHYLLIPIKVLIESIKFILGIIPPLLKLGLDLVKLFVTLTAGLINYIKNSERFRVLVENLKSGFELLKTGIRSTITFFKNLATTISKTVVNSLKDSNSWLNKTINLFKALGGITLIGLRTAFNSIANFKFSNITSSLEKMKTKLKEVGESNKIVKTFLDGFEKLKSAFNVLANAAEVFFEGLMSRLQKAESFGQFLQSIWDSLKDGYEFLKEFIESKFFKDGPGLFDKIKIAFQSFVDVLTGGMKNIPWAKLILIGFSLALATCTINLVTAISRFGGLAMALKETISIINQTIKTFTGLRNRLIELKEIAIFITAITAAITILSYVDKENGNLIKAAATLGILAGGLMVLAEAMLWINTKNALAPASLASLFGSIAAIAAGTAILVAAASALKDMSLSLEAALPYIKTLGVLMGGMLVAMTVLTLIGKDKKIFTAGAISILSYASAVYILAKGLTTLADIKFADINSLLKLLAATFGGFAVIVALTGTFEHRLLKFHSNSLAILAFAVSLKIVASALDDISKLHLSEDARNLLDQIIDFTRYFGTLIAICVTLAKIFGQADIKTKIIQKHATKLKFGFSNLAINLIAASLAFISIAKSFEILNRNLQNADDWGNFVALLVIFGTVVTALAVVFYKFSKNSHTFKNSNALLSFSVAVLALCGALVPLALALDLISDLVANNHGEDIAIAAGIIAGVGLLMGYLMAMAGKLKLTSFKAILSVFAGVGLLMAELIAVSILVENKGDAIAASIGALLSIAVIMGGLFTALALVEKKIGTIDIKPIIAVSASLVTLAGVLVGLTFLADSKYSDGMVKAFFALVAIAALMVGVFASFAAIQKELGTVGSIIKPLIGVVGSMVVLAGVLVGLAMVIKTNGDAVKAAMTDLGLIAVGLIAVFAAFSAINKYLGSIGNWAVLLSFGAVLAIVAGGLFALAQVPWPNLVVGTAAILAISAAMTVLLGVVAVINYALPGASLAFALFAAGVAGIVGSFALFTAAVGYFTNAVARVVEALVELGKNGDQVASGIKKAGQAIAQAINDISKAIVNAAPRLAEAAKALVIGIAKGLSEGAVYIAQAIATIIQVLMPVIAEAIQTLGGVIVEGINTLLDGLLEKSIDFVDVGKKLLMSLVNALIPANGEVAQVAKIIISEFIANLIPGVSQISTIGKLFKQSFLNEASMSDADLRVITESHELAGANSGSAFAIAYERELTAGEKRIKSQASNIPSSVTAAMKKAGDNGSAEAKKSYDKVQNALYAGWTDTSRWYHTNVLPKVQNVKNDIAGGNDSILTRAINLGKGLKDNLIDYVSDKASPIVNEFTKFTDGLTESLNNATPAAAGAGDAIEGAGEKAKKGAKGIKEAKDEITDFVKKMEDSFNILDEFDLGLDEENPLTGDKLLSNMRSNIEGMTKWSTELTSLGTKLSQGLYKKLADMGPQGYKYVHAFTEMTKEQLDEVNRYYGQSLIIPTAVTQQIYTGMFETGQNVYTGLINGMNLPVFQQAGTDAATLLLTGMNTQLGIASPSKKTFQIGIYVTEGLTNGVKDPSAKEGLMYTIANICREILEKFRLGLPAKDFKLVGYQITDGLKMGIESGQKDVENAVNKVCSLAAKAATTVLQIHSPSRVFAKIGEFIDKGLAEGISNNTDEVENSVSRMAEATVENMRGAIETIQAVVDSDMDVEPVIRPVVDLSNVNSGSAAISSLMQSNFGTNVTMPQASFMTTSQLISNTDNTNVVDAIGMLQEDVINLKDAMTNIKMVLDTGTMVGAMTPAIDQQLGMRQVYAGRGM